MKSNNSAVLREVDLKHISKFMFGFTLAEVLITLGIIGVISAMTIPNLMTKYQMRVAETRLKKFYSTINQAIRLSTIENDDPDGWITPLNNASDADKLKYVQTYFSRYWKLDQCKIFTYQDAITSKTVACSMGNGEGLLFDFIGTQASGARMMFEYVPNYQKLRSDIRKHPKNCFFFTLNNSFNWDTHVELTSSKLNYVIPYDEGWDGTYEGLVKAGKYSCSKNFQRVPVYCTKLIQVNNWKIPDDYYWY